MNRPREWEEGNKIGASARKKLQYSYQTNYVALYIAEKSKIYDLIRVVKSKMEIPDNDWFEKYNVSEKDTEAFAKTLWNKAKRLGEHGVWGVAVGVTDGWQIRNEYFRWVDKNTVQVPESGHLIMPVYTKYSAPIKPLSGKWEDLTQDSFIQWYENDTHSSWTLKTPISNIEKVKSGVWQVKSSGKVKQASTTSSLQPLRSRRDYGEEEDMTASIKTGKDEPPVFKKGQWVLYDKRGRATNYKDWPRGPRYVRVLSSKPNSRGFDYLSEQIVEVYDSYGNKLGKKRVEVTGLMSHMWEPVSRPKWEKEAPRIDEKKIRSLAKKYLRDFEEEDNLEWSTREHGDVGSEQAGKEDIIAANKFARAIRNSIPGAEVSVDVVDEWVTVSVRQAKFASERVKKAADMPEITDLKKGDILYIESRKPVEVAGRMGRNVVLIEDDRGNAHRLDRMTYEMSLTKVERRGRTIWKGKPALRFSSKKTAAQAYLTTVGEDVIRPLSRSFINNDWNPDQKGFRDAVKNDKYGWVKFLGDEPDYDDFMDSWDNWMNDRRRAQMMKKWRADDGKGVFDAMVNDYESRKKEAIKQAKKAAQFALTNGMPSNSVHHDFYKWRKGTGVVFTIWMNNSLIKFAKIRSAGGVKNWLEDLSEEMGLEGEITESVMNEAKKRMKKVKVKKGANLDGVRKHKLMPNNIKNKIPKLYSTENDEDPTVWVKYFNPYGRGTWYITEFDGRDTMFGWADLGHGELGYISLKELEKANRNGLPLIERDLSWRPKPLSKSKGR